MFIGNITEVKRTEEYLYSENIIWADTYYAKQIQKAVKKLESSKTRGCSKSDF